MQSKLTDERIGKIVEALAKKAEEGHIKSLEFLLTIGGFVPAVPRNITVNQYFAGDKLLAQESSEDGHDNGKLPCQ